MSAPYIIPFNFQPVNTGVSSGSYTVPAGKYARVAVTCSASVVPKIIVSNTALSYYSNDGAVTSNQVFYLKAGDIVTVSTTNNNGSYAIGASTTLYPSYTNTASILINAVIASTVASTTAFVISNSSGGGQNYEVIGNATVNYTYEEFNVIA